MVFFFVIVCRMDFSHVRPSLVSHCYKYSPCLRHTYSFIDIKRQSQSIIILMIRPSSVNLFHLSLFNCSFLSQKNLQ